MSGRAGNGGTTTLPETTVTAPAPSSTAAKLDPRQTHADLLETQHSHLDGRQAAIHTAMPGTIVSYDGTKMTAVVTPCLQGLQTMDDGTIKPVTIANIADVPVCFPGGGSHILTFPVAKGDDCMLLFNERSIDNWYQHGGPQKPSDWRMHDINDAVVLVGIRAQPHVLGGGGGGSMRASAPSASTGTTQLRSDDGNTLVQIDGPNNAVNVYCNTTHVFVDGKNSAVTVTAPNGVTVDTKSTVTINAPNGVTMNTPILTVTGVINVNGEGTSGDVGVFNGTIRATQDVIANTVSGHDHVHTGVMPGGGDTGKPVP